MEAGEIVNLIPLKLLLLAGPLLLTGCQNPNIYYWGHYENLVYVMYAKPDKVSPEVQAQTMEQDLHKAQAANKPVPPGFHAHLGYLYYQTGKPELARQEFENEKKQFPESTVFMNRMLANLSKK
jgi:hypothetical protein